jgi:hypothetical protein
LPAARLTRSFLQLFAIHVAGCGAIHCQPSLEEERLRADIGKQVLGIFENAFRADIAPDARRNIVEQTVKLADFLRANCRSEPNCFDRFPRPTEENIEFYLSKLRAEAEHEQPQEILVATIRQFAELVVVNLPDAPVAHQKHRSSVIPLAGMTGFTRSVLAAEYAAYRRRIGASPIDSDRSAIWGYDLFPVHKETSTQRHYPYAVYVQVQAGRPLFGDPDLTYLEDFGQIFQIVAGPPMFYDEDLTYFDTYDSTFPARKHFPPDGYHTETAVTYRFTPATDVGASRLTAAHAQKIADTGLLFGCETSEVQEETCFFFSSTSRGKESTFQISFCAVSGDVTKGQPSWCAPFIVSLDGELWIAVQDKLITPGEGGGEIDFWSELGLTVYTNKPRLDLITVLAEVLQSAPLSLDVTLSNKSLRGTSGQRYSEILSTSASRWHEWLMVKADESECHGGMSVPKDWEHFRTSCLNFTVNLLVNKQQDSNLSSWHPPSQQLSLRMLNVIKKAFLRKLAVSCMNERIIGDQIACIDPSSQPSPQLTIGHPR